MIPILYVGGIQLSKLQLLHCEISEKKLGCCERNLKFSFQMSLTINCDTCLHRFNAIIKLMCSVIFKLVMKY